MSLQASQRATPVPCPTELVLTLDASACPVGARSATHLHGCCRALPHPFLVRLGLGAADRTLALTRVSRACRTNQITFQTGHIPTNLPTEQAHLVVFRWAGVQPTGRLETRRGRVVLDGSNRRARHVPALVQVVTSTHGSRATLMGSRSGCGGVPHAARGTGAHRERGLR